MVFGFAYVIQMIGTNKKERLSAPNKMAPSARLEHATYCSASKRSNPLSYEGFWQSGILMQNQRLVK